MRTMIDYLKRRVPPPPRTPAMPLRPAAVPPDMRVYAVGDIHGRIDLLARLHRLIQRHAAGIPSNAKYIIYLGDFVDRGPASREVIDLLLDHPLPGFRTIFLRGNHEDALLRFLENPAGGSDWLTYGGVETLQSYGVTVSEAVPFSGQLLTAHADFEARLPEAHRRFLTSLQLSAEAGDYFFVHAGIRPGVALEEQDEQDMMWIREAFLSSAADHGKVIVHGHTIRMEPEVRPNRIGIDTGAYATGRLTCLVLDGTDRWFLST